MSTKLMLASNLPGSGKTTKVIGAKMQRFCNCNVAPPSLITRLPGRETSATKAA